MRVAGKEIVTGISINKNNMGLLDAYAEAGFDVVEILLPAAGKLGKGQAVVDEVLEQAHQTLEKVKATGLRLWSFHLPFSNQWDISSTVQATRLSTLECHAAILSSVRGWGASLATLHPSAEPILPENRDARLRNAREAVAYLARGAKAAGLQIGLEDLPRTCLGNQAGELAWLIGGGTVCGVTFDVNHLLNQSHAAFLDVLEGAVCSTHLSDYDGLDERHWLPGMGIVPWPLVFRRLTDAGYTGPFLFELGKDASGGQYAPRLVLEAFRKAVEAGEGAPAR